MYWLSHPCTESGFRGFFAFMDPTKAILFRPIYSLTSFCPFIWFVFCAWHLAPCPEYRRVSELWVFGYVLVSSSLLDKIPSIHKRKAYFGSGFRRLSPWSAGSKEKASWWQGVVEKAAHSIVSSKQSSKEAREERASDKTWSPRSHTHDPSRHSELCFTNLPGVSNSKSRKWF